MLTPYLLLHCGDAQTMPYADATFDTAFSLFDLMFFPDHQKGLAEIHRSPAASIIFSNYFLWALK